MAPTSSVGKSKFVYSRATWKPDGNRQPELTLSLHPSLSLSAFASLCAAAYVLTVYASARLKQHPLAYAYSLSCSRSLASFERLYSGYSGKCL